MKKGNLYRIYPNKEQKVLLEKHFGACRFIYNRFLSIRQTMYSKFEIGINRGYLDDLLSEKKELGYLKELHPWLKEVNSQSLQQANKNLDNAYTRFFKGLGGYPQRKKKKDNNSFQVPQHYKINISTSEIFIPVVGWIKLKMHRQLFKEMAFEDNVILKDTNPELLKTLTVSRTPTRKYHVSILTEDNIDYPQTQPYTHETMIGIDVGIKTFTACSNGEKIDNPRFLKTSLEKLKFLQKNVSRKVKGSKNRRKAIHKLAKLHEKIANQRHDFQHKVSLNLICENQAIAVETLNIQGMKKNHKLAQAVSDSAWYSFVLKLEYKAQIFGKNILKINQWEPSSKTCNVCGFKLKELNLDIREWQCPSCNVLHDRDINAAINIKKFATVGTTD
jgi:putative transposase